MTKEYGIPSNGKMLPRKTVVVFDDVEDASELLQRLMTNWLITAGHSFSLVLRYWVVIQLEILFQSTEETEIITIRQESLKRLLTMLMDECKLV